MTNKNDVHPVLEHDDGRAAPSRGLTAPTLMRPIGPVSVELDLADALQAGLSMRAMVKLGYVPDPTTAELYERVGAQLVASARVAAKGIGVPR